MHSWKKCGVYDGYSLGVETNDWANDCFWASEVIQNPIDKKYYMYFSASMRSGWEGKDLSQSSQRFDRLYLSAAVSDTPVGPFSMLYNTDEESGNRVPTINFKAGLNLEYPWAAIDVSPFFDDDGTLYLYFNKHTDDHYTYLNGSWGVKMNSMTEPDYSSLTWLTAHGYYTVTSTPGTIDDYSFGKTYFSDESGINEGQQVIKHGNKYFLTYSSNGYTDTEYSVHQAVSDFPLGPFVKFSNVDGNPLLSGSVSGLMSGTGHHGFVKNGNDLWIVYHRHASSLGYTSSPTRCISADRVMFVKNDKGEDVLAASGPSVGLQPLPNGLNGYTNLAEIASVSVSNGTGVDYLTDGILPFYAVTQDKLFSAEGDVVITLRWNRPVNVRAIMLYNSNDLNTAFSSVYDIRFKTVSSDTKNYYKVIQDLKYPERYYNPLDDSSTYVICAPAVAEFNTLYVTEIQITILAKDRFEEFDRTGKKNEMLNLTEIVVLGGKQE